MKNDIDPDFENNFDQQQFQKQFVAYNCKGYSSQEISLQTKFRTSLTENSVEFKKIVLK